MGEVDDVLVLVRGGGSLTLQRLEDLVDGVAEILGRGVRLHIGASVEQQPEERLSLTVLGAVPVAETSVSPSVVLQREAEPQTVLVPEEKSFLGEGKPLFSLLLLPRLTNRNGIRSRTFPSPSPGGMNVNWKRNWCP